MFARYEFAVRYTLCSSDSETISVRDLLALDAQPEAALQGLLDLRLGYTGIPPKALSFSSPQCTIIRSFTTETLGLPALRTAVAELYKNVRADDVFVTAGAEEAIFLFFTAVVRRGQAVVVHYPAYQSLYQVRPILAFRVLHCTCAAQPPVLIGATTC
jgi:aspartate/methionine/tyrosine aminotransferase